MFFCFVLNNTQCDPEMICIEPMCLRCFYYVGIWGVLSCGLVWLGIYHDVPWSSVLAKLLSLKQNRRSAICNEKKKILLTVEKVLGQNRANPLLWATD